MQIALAKNLDTLCSDKQTKKTANLFASISPIFATVQRMYVSVAKFVIHMHIVHV